MENPGIGITIFNEELREYMGVSEETAITPEEAMASHVAEAEFRADNPKTVTHEKLETVLAIIDRAACRYGR